jgi:riboflavin kinase/FMN adenylyltransferase
MKYKGIVQKGGAYGRKLGFPTANIPLGDAEETGIFVARVEVDENLHDAVVYADRRNKVFEAHILDFSGDLYGKEIGIVLVKKIREDKNFESEQEARQTIAADIEAARVYFNRG